ncbi:MAG TPA: metallopeptidase TldD-related protein [Jatrophihabitans sp.]|nr:metallopeptidase TldD-related protein [Jatrophihabitans sp.]
MTGSPADVCYLETSRHYWIDRPAGSRRPGGYAALGERGCIRTALGTTHRFTGPPPGRWPAPPAPPPAEQGIEQLEQALSGLHASWRGRISLRYSQLRSERLTVSSLAHASPRSHTVWSATGWFRPVDRLPAVPLGWSGRGNGLDWLSGSAPGELELLARAMSGAAPVTPGYEPAVLAPPAAAVVVHETVAHQVETPPQGTARPSTGQRIAAEQITAFDDPTAESGPAHYDLDDDNVRALGPMAVVTDGRQTAWLHSAASAVAHGTLPTGNGRSAGAWDLPLPRTSNLVVQAGTATEAELIDRTYRGLYVRRLAHGVNDGARFEADLVLAERIDQGRLTGRYVVGGRLSESLELLLRVTGVADNPRFHYSGLCGKAGQLLFDVGTAAPSIELSGLRVLV